MYTGLASWSIFVLILLKLIAKTQLSLYDSGHGFISDGRDEYVIGDIMSIHKDFLDATRDPIIDTLRSSLRFEPEFLDFKQRPLGMPHVEQVRLINMDKNKSIDMTSISGSTVHFHSSFFNDKRIPPLGNTTFNVVFLGREEGAIESSLYIHTTEGYLKYHVKGESIFSPYRLRPIIGIKLPINVTFSPLIYMHNPHLETIQITEMYSSGGHFHLELPSGELEGPKDLWEIRPLETKAVIRVHFSAKLEQNHTAYVRIRLNNTQDILVVPLEVEVSSDVAPYPPYGPIDFGVGGISDQPKSVKLFLQSPTRRPIHIQSVKTTSKAIKIFLEGSKFPTDMKNFKKQPQPFAVATLTLDWRAAFKNKDFNGKIIVEYKNTKSNIEIPYFATVINGGLSFNSSTFKYLTKHKLEDVPIRTMVVKNDYIHPITLLNVSFIKGGSYFYISDFSPVILSPKEERGVFSLNLRHDVSLFNTTLNSSLLLETNISQVKIPLMVYDGKLQLYLPYESGDNTLNLGLIKWETTQETYIMVLNTNPVPVKIKRLETFLTGSTLELIGCDKQWHENVLLRESFGNLTKCKHIKPNEYAILRLNIKMFRSEEQVFGEIFIYTDYEQLSIPVNFKTGEDKFEIVSDNTMFDKCFPGRLCSLPLRIHSTFSNPVVINRIVSIPPDSRISSKQYGSVKTNVDKLIAHLYFDPTINCKDKCYVGMTQDIFAQWLNTLDLINLAPDFDLNLVNTFYNRYLNQTSTSQFKWDNITIRMDTSEVKGYTFRTKVNMIWPSLISEIVESRVVTFPLTQVGNITYQNVTLRNPTSSNLVVQLVMEDIYPGIKVLQEGLPPDFVPGKVFSQSRGMFFYHVPNSNNNDSEHKLNVKINNNTMVFILSPGSNHTITFGYKAVSDVFDSLYVFIRNNLTVLEVIHLHGQGIHPSFKLGNRRPGSLQPLQFDFTEKNLKECESKENKFSLPSLATKRTFTSRNGGDVTIYVNGFYINGLPCEGYGFKILNCEPFILPPNGTRKIDIAFSPDFTLSKITRTLILDTSLSDPVNYTLVATIPVYYLPLCAGVLSRPYWEKYLSNLAICTAILSLITIFVTTVFESERLLNTMFQITRNGPSMQSTLDLRLIGAQTRLEIRSSPRSETNLSKPVDTESKSNEKQLDDKEKQLVVDTNKMKSEDKLISSPSMSKTKKLKNGKKINVAEVSHNISNVKKHVLSDACDMKKCMEKYKQVNNNIKCEEKKDEIREYKSKNPLVESKIQSVAVNVTPLKKSIQKERKVNYKKTEKPPELNVYEEETSSTTTEGSTNEEIEKFIKTTIRKSNLNNFQKNDISDKVTHGKIEQKRPLIKRNKENSRENKNDIKPKTNKISKDRRYNLNKKFSTEKGLNSNKDISMFTQTNTKQFCQPKNMWNESRASFSDVVARSDCQSPTSRLIQVQNAKPTMFVEPYKQTTNELGPIGSHRENCLTFENINNLDNHDLLSGDLFNRHDLSFFNGNVLMENPHTRLNHTHEWQQTNTSSMYLNYLQRHYMLSEPWPPNVNNVWNDSVNSGINEISTRPLESQNAWSWGSTVWKPLSTEITRPSTRTPPGFETHSSTTVEEHTQVQQNVYNPFGVRNIWSDSWNNQEHH